VFAGEVLGFLHYRADILMIMLWQGQAQVGLYATAAFLSELLWMIPRGVYAPVFARIAGNGLERRTIRLASAVTLGVTGAAALAAALLIGPAIGWLYGSDFSGAARPFILLLPGTVLLALPKLLEAPLIAELGAPQVLAWAKGAGLVANLGLNFLLIPRYGISGAAAASSLSYSLQAGLFLWLFAKNYRRRPPGIRMGDQLVVSHENEMNELAD
jgi:O-antigen/teichoic acid export membrane protein